MNSDQIKSALTSLLLAAGLILGLLPLLGMSPATVEKLQAIVTYIGTNAATIVMAIGGLAALAAPVIGWVRNRLASRSASVESIPGVKVVVTDPTVAPADMVNAAMDPARPNIELKPEGQPR